MNEHTRPLVESLRRWTLFLGALQMTTGCVVGLVPPSAVPWFRGIVMAHIEFTVNGILVIALGLLLRELRLGPVALKAWFAGLQIGTWTNGGSGLLAALAGASSPFLPTLSQAFPPPHGTQHPGVSALLLVCGVTILAVLLLTLHGLAPWRAPAPRPSP